MGNARRASFLKIHPETCGDDTAFLKSRFPPWMSLRGAFYATKQSPHPAAHGIASVPQRTRDISRKEHGISGERLAKTPPRTLRKPWEMIKSSDDLPTIRYNVNLKLEITEAFNEQRYGQPVRVRPGPSWAAQFKYAVLDADHAGAGGAYRLAPRGDDGTRRRCRGAHGQPYRASRQRQVHRAERRSERKGKLGQGQQAHV